MFLKTQDREPLNFCDGVWVSPGTSLQYQDFEKEYITVRRKEQRVFTIEEIRQLPIVGKGYIHSREWAMRRKSIQRFGNYLEKKKPFENILDIGCGNGFFTNFLSAYSHSVFGVDVNMVELKQASAAFASNPKLQWYYTDILEDKLFKANSFDLITFCCSFQYFPDVRQIINICLGYLKPGGAIHIIDTPFYKPAEVDMARSGTVEYYNSMGVWGMGQYYFHHQLNDIAPFEPVIHHPGKKGLFPSLFAARQSPFPWIEIIKQ
jgi:ubiquinone/menaquinone biosynthesis C-methylase UbiE